MIFIYTTIKKMAEISIFKYSEITIIVTRSPARTEFQQSITAGGATVSMYTQFLLPLSVFLLPADSVPHKQLVCLSEEPRLCCCERQSGGSNCS